MASVRISFGKADLGNVPAQLSAQTTRAVAQAAIRRVQKRVNHPSTRRLAVRSLNQYSASITGVAGPSIIRPRRARALRFVAGGGVVFAKSVRSPGMGALVTAESRRVSTDEVDISRIRIT